MNFLKADTKNCPYCKQPLIITEHKFYCNTEGCNKSFDKFIFQQEDKNNVVTNN